MQHSVDVYKLHPAEYKMFFFAHIEHKVLRPIHPLSKRCFLPAKQIRELFQCAPNLVQCIYLAVR